MSAKTVRFNVILPSELADQLRKVAGPRKRSEFITDAIKQRLKEMQKRELDALLEEGYRVGSEESFALAKDFEAVDLEGWDEY